MGDSENGKEKQATVQETRKRDSRDQIYQKATVAEPLVESQSAKKNTYLKINQSINPN